MFGHDLIFISFNENDYINFINHTNVCLPFYKVDSFEEICVAINSCKLFTKFMQPFNRFSLICIALFDQKRRVAKIRNIIPYEFQCGKTFKSELILR